MMIMLKKIILAILIAIIPLTGCGQKEEEISFVGTIIDITDTYAHMSVDEGETILASGDEVTFTITDELKAGKDFTPEAGDRVSVTIRGDILETYPLQVTAVSWAPDLEGGAYISTETNGQADYPLMIMIEGRLYHDSGEIAAEPGSAAMDGEITSYTDSEPNQDNQSNFGTGYGYQYGEDDTIQVLIDNDWRIFIPYDEKSADENKLTDLQKMEQEPNYKG